MSVKLIPLRIKNYFVKRRLMRSLKGDNVECVICENKFKQFMPFGVPPAKVRENAQCPNCRSLERTRIYWHYLSSLDGFLSSKVKILHTAPESSLFKKFTSIAGIDYNPIDKFADGYTYPEPTKNMDITNLKFEDDTFDFVLSSHVLEHVIEDVKAMEEFYRVLKPEGFGLLQVPIEMDREITYEDSSITEPEDRKNAFGQFDHVRIYGKDYVDRLKSVGFKVEVIDYTENMTEEEAYYYGFGKNELLFVVKK